MKVVVWIRLREGSSGGKVLIVFNDSMIRGGCAGSGGGVGVAAPPAFSQHKSVPFSQNTVLWKMPIFVFLSQYPLSVFWPEGSPEEQKRFLRDFCLAEDLPVRFYLDSLSLSVERMTPLEGFQWNIVWFRWKSVATRIPLEAQENQQKLSNCRNSVSGGF